jgi:hypothetical protein
MIIKVDAEGNEIIKQLCDIALKTYGLSNLEGVTKILSSVELLTAVEMDALEEVSGC